MTTFDVDLSEVLGYHKWCRGQPPKLRVANAVTLNRWAYGVRTEAIAELGRVMTIRNPRFVASRIQYSKAYSSQPIESQQSVVGSVAVARFSGWTEQEYGTNTDRKRYGTLLGRSGNFQKQLRPSVRLKPSVEVVTPNSAGYRPAGGPGNIGGFFAMLLRNKETRLARVGTSLYKRNRGKMELVQELKRKQPKQIHWLKAATDKYFAKTSIIRTWAEVYEPLMGKPGRM